MATLYITEFASTAIAQGQQIAAALIPVLVNQTVAIAGASAQSAALNAGTTLVRLNTDTACSILVGANPTATTSVMRMSAGATEYFVVQPNSALKIAVISNN